VTGNWLIGRVGFQKSPGKMWGWLGGDDKLNDEERTGAIEKEKGCWGP